MHGQTKSIVSISIPADLIPKSSEGPQIQKSKTHLVRSSQLSYPFFSQSPNTLSMFIEMGQILVSCHSCHAF